MSWEPIKTAPSDRPILLGVWVKHKRDTAPRPEYYVVRYNKYDDTLKDIFNEHSLPFDDINEYDFWTMIPQLPEAK